MSEKKYTKKDFTSDKLVKWCPGCGDYAILAAVQKTMADLGRPKEQQVVISGIGCSSRFPIYMDTHGFHTIHGRAPSVATGVKVANPDLDIWLVTGDGDGLSIGGNHLLHAIRRNVNMVVLLFNNKVYGLTKGQYSPTSEVDTVTKSTPYGSIDEPINPLSFALSAGATFVARTYDTNPKHMQHVFSEARKHRGLSFIEIYQNCVIFNDGAHDNVLERTIRSERLVELMKGEKLIFGKEKDKCLVFEGLELTVKNVADVSEADIVTHETAQTSPTYAKILADLQGAEVPSPIGIFRQVERPVYNDAVIQQTEDVKEKYGMGDLQNLLNGNASWEVKSDAHPIEEEFTAFVP
jgi:2-oxoglutarate/2-oxoacid ferredoxin oxidoreductase subunit beta